MSSAAFRLVAALLLIAPLPLAAKPTPRLVRVKLATSYGPIVLALETRRAPKTSANFLAYVDDHRFDGITFYRAARSRRSISARPAVSPVFSTAVTSRRSAASRASIAAIASASARRSTIARRLGT